MKSEKFPGARALPFFPHRSQRREGKGEGQGIWSHLNSRVIAEFDAHSV
jgi:hypothetical protein